MGLWATGGVAAEPVIAIDPGEAVSVLAIALEAAL